MTLPSASSRALTLLQAFCCVLLCPRGVHSQTEELGSRSNGSVVPCGNMQQMVDNCFSDLPPHLMEFLQTTKIAINEQEIISKCTVFDRGMRCFDEYTARCLPHQRLHLFENNVEGARKFFVKFCNDRDFQKDYLRHKDCFSYIQEDWMRCTRKFQNILSEELHMEHKNVTHKFIEFCCARYAYENCIYTSARYKCYQHSAAFARDTAKMLSDEKHFSHCRQYETAMCAADVAPGPVCHWSACLGALLLLLALQVLMLSPALHSTAA